MLVFIVGEKLNALHADIVNNAERHFCAYLLENRINLKYLKFD